MNKNSITMEKSITILKDFFKKHCNKNLELDYKLIISSEEDYYELIVESKITENITRFFINKPSGKITHIRVLENPISQKKLPKVTRTDAEKTAKAFLRKVLGTRCDNLKLNEDIDVIRIRGINEYVFWYKEYLNNIEINKSYMMIYVDGYTNEISYFDNGLIEDFKINDLKSTIISENDALNLLKDNIKFTLSKSVYETPIYEPSTAIEGHFIDALNGEYINEYKFMEETEDIHHIDNLEKYDFDEIPEDYFGNNTHIEKSTCNHDDNIPLDLINIEKAKELFYENVKLYTKYLEIDGLLNLVYAIKPMDKKYYGIVINAVDGTLNDQYTNIPYISYNIENKKYQRELEILSQRYILDEDFNFDAEPTVRDVLRLLSFILNMDVDSLQEDLEYSYSHLEKGASLQDIRDLFLYALNPYDFEEEYDSDIEDLEYLKVIENYKNKRITNEDLAHIFYTVFSQ